MDSPQRKVITACVLVALSLWLLISLERAPENSPQPNSFPRRSTETETEPASVPDTEDGAPRGAKGSESESDLPSPEGVDAPLSDELDAAEPSSAASDSAALGRRFQAALEQPTRLPINTVEHMIWSVARDAWVDATKLRIVNGFGLQGRSFWNFANLRVHQFESSSDGAIASTWVDLLSRVCGEPVELETTELVRTLRTWSERADDIVYRTYRAHGIDAARLHLWSAAETRGPRQEILDQFGDELDGFVAEISACFTDSSAAGGWEAFVDWLESRDSDN